MDDEFPGHSGERRPICPHNGAPLPGAFHSHHQSVFLVAFGVNLNDILIPHLKKAFELTDFQSSFIQVAFFGGYFLAAFPAGRVMEKIGYKKGILAGLFLCAVGAVLFLPASSSRIYGFFLFALFVMACGQSFLEVAANPYVTTLGPSAS